MSRTTGAARTARMEQVRQRIEHWRETRARRGRMPERLWEAAVALAREHGVYATSRGLRLNYDSLRARVRGRRPQRRSSKPREAAFVELGPALPLGPVSPAGPVVELTGADGQKLTLRLAGPDELDLPGLVREFWSREA
jgi:hypothetical protein